MLCFDSHLWVPSLGPTCLEVTAHRRAHCLSSGSECNPVVSWFDPIEIINASSVVAPMGHRVQRQVDCTYIV